MNEGKSCRGFIWDNKAWYYKVIPKDKYVCRIDFGIYDTDGGTTGEMTMKWFDLDGENVPRLEAFNDSWETLASFKDVIDAMALVDGKNITDEEFVKILLSCGFTDRTEYIRKE
jgi:hypothetical protein